MWCRHVVGTFNKCLLNGSMATFIVASYRVETPTSPSDFAIYLASHEHDLMRWLTELLRKNFDRSFVNLILTTNELKNLAAANSGQIFSRPAFGVESIRVAWVRNPNMPRRAVTEMRIARATLRRRLCDFVAEELRKKI